MHHFQVPRLLIALLFTLIASSCAVTPPARHSGETNDVGAFVADARTQVSVVGAPRVLAVFDLDNTLLAMEQGLGSDQWYEWQKEQHAHEPCDPRVVGDRLAVQGALYFASAMRPTQPDAPELLRELQDLNVPVIALTSRGVDFRLQTFRELRRNGYDFRRSALSPEAGWPDDFVPDNGIRPVRYEDGVFLTTGQHKGAMLDALLRKTGAEMPSVILMLDDKQTNLDAIHETFDPLGVSVRSWRYAGEDGLVAGFDPEASDRLWQQAAPALDSLQQVFGADHYDLNGAMHKSGCTD
ncbi:MAG: DUF2608 domain-containing protein [Gammaproteobacteria bacterium]|nr:DUF2608 domain-containing protein [Gammaproteobacteria bacterium]